MVWRLGLPLSMLGVSVSGSHGPSGNALHGKRQGRKYSSTYLRLESAVFDFYVADEDLIKYAWPQDVWFHVDKVPAMAILILDAFLTAMSM